MPDTDDTPADAAPDGPADAGDDDTDAQADSHRLHAATIPVHPAGLNDFDPVEVRADVHIPESYAVAIAYRVGLKVAQGQAVTRWDVEGTALDYAQARERFIVDGTDTELVEWLREEAGMHIPIRGDELELGRDDVDE